MLIVHWYNLHQLFFFTLNCKVQQLLNLYLQHFNYLSYAPNKHVHIYGVMVLLELSLIEL